MISSIEKLLSRGTSILKSTGNGLIAVNKPSSIVSHPSESLGKGEARAVLSNVPYDHQEEAYIIDKTGRKVYLLNRLDRGTSGVMLLCMDRKLAGTIRRAFARREIEKEYTAICFGRTSFYDAATTGFSCSSSSSSSSRTEMVDYLEVVKKGKQIMVGPSSSGAPNALEAVTRLVHIEGGSIEVDSTALPIVMARLAPLTGYSHQLRYQLYARHLPILGDPRYHTEESKLASNLILPSSPSRKRKGKESIMLHSTSISISTGFDFKFHAEAPLPAEMTAIIRKSTIRER